MAVLQNGACVSAQQSPINITPGRTIGYARVSTVDQTCAQQIVMLERAGCSEIFEDVASGGSTDRPQFKAMLQAFEPGDVLVVVKLDRLSRSVRDLILTLDKLKERGVGFRSITEAIDMASPAGRMVLHLMGAFAEFERSLIRERTKLGLERARREGRRPGPKPKLTALQVQDIIARVAAGESQAAMARLHRVSKATICEVVKRARIAASG